MTEWTKENKETENINYILEFISAVKNYYVSVYDQYSFIITNMVLTKIKNSCFINFISNVSVEKE